MLSSYSRPNPCAQRVEIWDGPEDRIAAVCKEDEREMIIVPCVDRPRSLEMFIVNDEIDDVTLVAALHIGGMSVDDGTSGTVPSVVHAQQELGCSDS